MFQKCLSSRRLFVLDRLYILCYHMQQKGLVGQLVANYGLGRDTMTTRCINCHKFAKASQTFLFVGKGRMHIAGAGCRGPKFRPAVKAAVIRSVRSGAGLDLRSALESVGFIPAPSSLEM